MLKVLKLVDRGRWGRSDNLIYTEAEGPLEDLFENV